MVVNIAVYGRDSVYAFAKSSSGQYDIILMDIRMPVMGGCEATRAIRALNRPDAQTIPIIAMTADAFAFSSGAVWTKAGTGILPNRSIRRLCLLLCCA